MSTSRSTCTEASNSTKTRAKYMCLPSKVCGYILIRVPTHLASPQIIDLSNSRQLVIVSFLIKIRSPRKNLEAT